MIGTRLGHYRVVHLIGRGGMGEVYLAEDTRLQRQVALKLPARELAADPQRRERFEREARAVAALNHPNMGARARRHQLARRAGFPAITDRQPLDRGRRTTRTADQD